MTCLSANYSNITRHCLHPGTFGSLIPVSLRVFPIGEYDALPEQAFYMVGPIEEVVQKAEKLAEEHS